MRDGRTPAAATPWSFFVPVALAVLVGGLVAGLILRSLDAADGGDAATAPAPPRSGAGAGRASPPAATVEEATAVAVGPARPDAGTAAASVAADLDAAATPPALPGALLARRDGAPAACINGTIALRDENGWQQQLENDAPVACVEAPVPAP